MRDPPASHRGRGRLHRVAAIASRPSQKQGHRAPVFGRELEPARLGHLHAAGLADNGA